MGYTTVQKKEHIKELQRYLNGISYYNEQIPIVIPDGFYGKETATAVRAFQREYNLPETGNTDYNTWNKIVNVYRSYLDSQPASYNIFPSSKYIIREGDSGLLVYILQSMLDDIGLHYDNIGRVNINGNYNGNTATAVRNFQKIVNLPPNGIVDSGTWNMLVKTSEHINNTLVRSK